MVFPFQSGCTLDTRGRVAANLCALVVGIVADNFRG